MSIGEVEEKVSLIKERDYKGGTKTLTKTQASNTPKKKKKTLNHQKYMTRET